ncbi:MAG: hypothetical protein ACJ8AW_03690 [Rhodopila sp.]
MDATVKDWLTIACAMLSLCASLSVPIIVYHIGALRWSVNPVRLARKDVYTALLCSAARARDRFRSAAIRQKLQRTQPNNSAISTHVDEDLAAGWLALEELEQKLHAEQLICSNKVAALISGVKAKHFCNAESLFRMYGHAGLDIDDLHKHAQDLAAKLKRRCRQETGLSLQL